MLYPITKMLTGTNIESILERLGENLKDDTRNYYRERLEKKTKELQAFVSTVSHDLRTPLISIQGFSDTISSEFSEELDEQGVHYLDRIQANVDKMNEFIDDLLELSRVSKEDEEVVKEKVNTHAVAEEVISDLSSKIEERGIEVEIKRELPKVGFKRKRMYQVFSNLISNAVKYIGDPENPKIQIDAEEKPTFWVIKVKDNGIGIEEENQDKIFDIFHRENRVDEKGTGIGLAIVNRIIEKYDGDIWVESEKGEGTEFFVKLPKIA